jgi:hypothetical protein
MFLTQFLQLKEIVGSSEMSITTDPDDIRQIPRSFCLNAFSFKTVTFFILSSSKFSLQKLY